MNPIIVIGCGGIGSHLIEPLARYIFTMSAPPELVLVDGDLYSRENRDRQRIGPAEIGANKATAQARRLQAILPQLRVRAIEQFVSERNAAEIITEGSLTIACPDNHATRLAISRRCQRLRNVAAVFTGNDLVDGTVQVFIRRNGRSLNPPVETYHPEIAEPRDRNPSDLSCEELAARPGGGQMIATNFMAASLALNACSAILENRVLPYGEVFFDVVANVARATRR